MSIRQISLQAYDKSKYLLSRLKAKVVRTAPALKSDISLRSISDNGAYPELALRAAIDPVVYSNFRRHRYYTPILEHVSKEQAIDYLHIIMNKYLLQEEQIFNIIEPLQAVGSPHLLDIPGLSCRVSTTALRYLKVALDIKHSFGNNLGDVVEIGCGYGGQALILDRIANINSYTFFDLWQVNFLITRFIESSPFSAKYNVCTLRNNLFDSTKQWNLAISNYALSELPERLQQSYLKDVLLRSENGYLTMNSGVNGSFGGIKNLSQKQWLDLLEGSVISKEDPLTGHNNYILKWR